jgi:hypothetical protein
MWDWLGCNAVVGTLHPGPQSSNPIRKAAHQTCFVLPVPCFNLVDQSRSCGAWTLPPSQYGFAFTRITTFQIIEELLRI